MRAALSNSVDCISYLLSLNHPTDTNKPLVNVNQTDTNGLTVLHYANGNINAMKLLVEYPYREGVELDVNHQNKFEETALHWASRWGETECVKVLLSHPDIDVTLKNHAGKTAEDVCCYHIGRSVGQKSIILKLLQEKARETASAEETSTKKKRSNQTTKQQMNERKSLLQVFLLFLLAGKPFIYQSTRKIDSFFALLCFSFTSLINKLVIFAFPDMLVPRFLSEQYFSLKYRIHRSLGLSIKDENKQA